MNRMLVALALCLPGCIGFDATRERVCEVRGFCGDGGALPPPAGVLRVEVQPGGSGEIEWVEGARRCSTRCEFALDDAGVTLRALPGPGNGVVAWSGGCVTSPELRECATSGGADIVLELGPANLAFVTRTSLAVGSLADSGVVPGALIDEVCAAEAADAGLRGTYRAWLSHFENTGAGVPARASRDALGTASGWHRLDGLAFAQSRDALLSGEVIHPITYDSRGTSLGTATLIATGSGTNGDTVLPGGDCFSWSRNAGEFAYSRPTRAGPEWSNIGSGAPCQGEARFLCLGVDALVKVLAPKVPGRRVFVTENVLPSSVTSTQGDALCNAEALDAGLGGGYLMWRTNRDAGVGAPLPWVRTDGVPVLEGVRALRGVLQAPISRTARGSLSRSSVCRIATSSTTACEYGAVHDVNVLTGTYTPCPAGSSSGPVLCFEP